ncbi:MAG: hypothetical protein V3V70_02905 [Candidatus Scalindua sp.]
MPYRNKIKLIAANFPGLVNTDRLNILNKQLLELKEKGFNKLVENFLSNKYQYTLTPFLFELYLCRWILTIDNCKDVCYEPSDLKNPPDFRFKIDNYLFYVEAKAITQIFNELSKKKVVEQINSRISSKTNIAFEIWLSEDIAPKEMNDVIDWAVKESVQLSIGEKEEYNVNGEILASIKAIYKSESSGGIGSERILGTYDGEVKEIDMDIIREKIKSKIKKANVKFKSIRGQNDNTFNLLFLTCDSRVFLHKDIIAEVLYGREEVTVYQNGKCETSLQNNGIWSKEVYTNIDMVFFIEPSIDFLGKEFNPYIFPNPQKIIKLRKVPTPFCGMKTSIPSTLFGPKEIG